MKKVEKITFLENFKIILDGDFSVRLYASSEDFSIIEISYDFPQEDVSFNVNENELKILDKIHNHVDDDDFKNFKNSISNHEGVGSAIVKFLGDALSFKNKVQDRKRELFVDIFLQKNMEESRIEINAGNLNIDFGDVKLGELSVKSGNLKINQGGLLLNLFKIKSGNLRANLNFNNFSKNIEIKSANAKLVINKEIGFDGVVVASGNNLKIDNNLIFGNKDAGTIYAKINNGHIKNFNKDRN